MKFLQLAMQFARDARGVTAVEYALIAMLIGVALVATVFTLGGRLFEVFNQAGNALTNN